MCKIATLGLAALVVVAAARSAAAAEPTRSLGSRFYAGMTVATLDFDDNYEGLKLDDSSTGYGVYGGFRLKQRLALELSYDVFDAAIGLHDIAGSGIVRLDVATERRTTTLSAVRDVSFKELFDWRRDWRVYGTVGVYDSRLTTIATTLGSSPRTKSVDDRDTGVLFGAGTLYTLGRVELRGYLLSGGDVREAGIGAQFKF
jgi:hypothetical protein